MGESQGAEEPSTLKQQILQLLPEIRSPKGQKFFAGLVLVNLVFLFARPQFSLPFLSTLELPIVFSIFGGIAWVTQIRCGWTTQTKAMVALLLLMASWGPVARNNFWSFHIWRDVLQQFLCYLFPVVIFLSNPRDLPRVFKLCAFLGLYLGFYSILHQGAGPGSFLTDENDLCLALVMFFGLTAALALDRRMGSRWIYLSIAITIVVGIVATVSRGGFVGFVVALTYLLWRSQHKIITVFFGLCIFLSAFYFAPAHYWDEMSTIKETEEGTAKQRRELWAVGMSVWLYPQHFAAGVGQGNVPFYLGDFEPEENKTSSRKSIAGRAVHSMYVQLAAELGLAGIIIVLVTILSCIQGNNRIRKQLIQLRSYLSEIQRCVAALRVKKSGDLDKPVDSAEPEEDNNSVSYQNIEQITNQAATKADFYTTLLTGLNTSWIGVLVAATFISTLYYPPIWFLAALSAAVQIYLKRFYRAAAPFAQTALRESLNELARLERVR